MLMSIGGLVPLPSDALVTPVTFRVRKRHLRGILSEFDAAETGSRELSGEWVVGKKTWQRLQSEWRAARPQQSPDDIPYKSGIKTKEQVILYLHGGAYSRPIHHYIFAHFYLRCILPLQRGGATVNFYSIGQIYRCPCLWCVRMPGAFHPN
jgi:hypothetical protein